MATIASPLQAMSLHEAITAGVVDVPERIVVQGPRAAIRAVLELGDHGLARRAVDRSTRGQHLRHLASARELIVADPFSRMSQIAVLARRWHRIVVLEDGAAVLTAWRRLANGEPLVRAHGRSRLTRLLGALAVRTIRGDGHRVVIVAGIPLDPDDVTALGAVGIDVVQHDYTWTRTVAVPSTVTERANRRVVLGSALCGDGHLRRSAYESWLTTSFMRGPAAFVPHRRDPDWTLDLARRCLVETLPTDHLGAELLLRDLDGELEIACLPQTAALTIPLTRAGRPTRIVLDRIARDAWEPSAPRDLVRLLDDIAARVAGDHREMSRR